ncbi:DUF3306 domain-containing protein [Falsiroseomonas oryziterrae]|uniref:DUF3306 domain-containing protein n=1 Tax=Falsiroseomonas oryziterrae TaxID=2911368 RepID=UPI001F360AB8|nr:DUF3306 domain-containing protein [Roseomonas sp. NPKOSM-4]
MSGEEPEGFLSRWSRRKREVAVEPEPPAPTLAPAAVTDAPPVAVEPPGEEAAPEPSAGPAADPARPACPIPNLPEVDLASLPRIEDLTAESDFSAFLRPGVPQMLRNAALRRMWSLDPAIRDYIGPVDYQWDFNTPGGLPFGFANELTGDISKLLAQAIGKIEELAEEPKDEPMAEAGPESSPEQAPALADPAPEPPVLIAEAPVEPPPLPSASEEPPPPRRRHGGALPG